MKYNEHIKDLEIAKEIIARVVEDAFDGECRECSVCGYNRPTYPPQSQAANMGNAIINKIERIVAEMQRPDFCEPRGG